MKSLRILLLPIIATGILLTGCDSSATGENETASVSLFLQPVFDGAPLSSDLSTVYDLNGTAITFNTARFYVSEIELVKEDGSTFALQDDPVTVPAKDENDTDITHTVEDMIVLVKHDLGTTHYDLGELPAGSYTGIRYKIGIDGLNNRVDASQVPAGHALAKQTDRNNHWNWSAGYQYIRLDGLVDSDDDGTPDEVWETHLGTTNFLSEISQSMDFELHDGDDKDFHIIVDYKALLNEVDLSDPDQRLCHTGDNLPVANKVLGEVANAFMFHGVHDVSGHGH